MKEIILTAVAFLLTIIFVRNIFKYVSDDSPLNELEQQAYTEDVTYKIETLTSDGKTVSVIIKYSLKNTDDNKQITPIINNAFKRIINEEKSERFSSKKIEKRITQLLKKELGESFFANINFRILNLEILISNIIGKSSDISKTDILSHALHTPYYSWAM